MFFRSLVSLLVVAFGTASAWAQRPAKPSDLKNYFIGNATRPSNATVNGPGILLMGGGSECDLAFTSYAYPLANGGDFVVLRTDSSSGYQNYLYTQLVAKLPADQRTTLKPNSVETLVVNSRAKANYDYVSWVVSGANFVFIAGGDQSEYLSAWKGTALETALRGAYARGAVLGGTSAGACLMGEFIYDPGNQSAATSAEAIANPYRASIIFTTGFGGFSLMKNTYVEPHFAERTRMGRALSYMARLRQDELAGDRCTVLALDEGTALYVDPQGLATMQRQYSTGAAYVFTESRRRTRRRQIAAGQPVIYRNVQRYKLTPGDTFQLNTRATTLLPLNVSVEGASSPTLNPASPY